MILVSTPHSVVAGGYHRNDEAMRDVISAYMGPPERARALVKARGIGFVVHCHGLLEANRYLKRAPDGFMAKLERGEAPDWLEPVPAAGGADLAVWRVKEAR